MEKRRVESLRPHPENLRLYGPTEVRELVEQIRRSHWIKPLVVTPSGVIISGHRRWEAARDLGLAEVPVEVREFASAFDELEALLLENAYREKTVEQRVREAEAWLRVERERARARQQEAARQTNRALGRGRPEETLVKNFSQASVSPDERKTTMVVARRVGLGTRPTYERAATVVRVADELAERGETDRAQRLLEVLNKRSVHAAYQQVRALAPPPAPSTPPPVLPREAPLLAVADARALPLPAGVVDLIVTSPPYGLEKPYAVEDDSPERWADFMAAWLAEAARVSREGGRLALNVPLDTTAGGYRPTYAQAVAAAITAGWSYRSTIVWAEGNVSKSTGRGSVDSASAPHVIAPVEMIALFSRGPWHRDPPAGRPSDLAHEDWLAWTNGLWQFGGETRAWEGHPAAFPEELPRRLIHLLSFPGDVVLDPFVGSGTTALVAWRLGRRAIGFDLSTAYIAAARRRLASCLVEEPHHDGRLF